MALVHHELCFGCGRTNLFGLLLEAERTGSDAVAGRCFVKQDHQGSHRGLVHEGILATAMVEAMAFACVPDADVEIYLRRLEVRVDTLVGVGQFIDVEARLERREGSELHATASAKTEADYVCSASGSFALWQKT